MNTDSRRPWSADAVCPYPGPRPLNGENDPDWMFFGREKLVDQILWALSANAVVVLHGMSGAGKSSLLNMRVEPYLRGDDQVVVVVDKWAQLRGDFDEFLRNWVLQIPWLNSVHEQITDRNRHPIDVLDDIYPGRIVLVLDQFEELMRGRSAGYQSLAECIKRVSGDRQRNVKIVISLRSEYLHRMKEIQTPPGSTVEITIGSDLSADEVVTMALLHGDNVPEEIRQLNAIDEPAARWLAKVWVADPSSKSALDLQATLYDWWWQAHATQAPLSLDSVQHFFGIEQCDNSATASDKSFQQMLGERYLGVITRNLKRQQATHLAGDTNFSTDRPGILSTTAMYFVREMAPLLSSGGYKLDLSVWDIFQQVCEWELEDVLEQITPNIGDELRRAAAECLAGTLDEATPDHVDVVWPGDSGDPGLSDIRRWLADEHDAPPWVPWEDDKLDVTAGPFMGCPPIHLVKMQIRAFVLALMWVQEAHLVKLTRREQTETESTEASTEQWEDAWGVSLVHDRMGDPLIAWANQGDSEQTYLWSTARAWLGERIQLGNQFDTAVGSGNSKARYLVNLRWLDCRITGAFKNVVFVNCDFRRSQFCDCAFGGVTFLNCLLDGASFIKCAIQGESLSEAERQDIRKKISSLDGNSQPDDDQGQVLRSVDRLPSYYVKNADSWLLDDWSLYRAGLPTSTENRWMYSLAAGVGAYVVSDNASENSDPWDCAPGGVRIYGGRINALSLEHCDFSDDDSLTFFSVAGASLNLVEMRNVRVNLVRCAIRGLAVTAKLRTAGREAVSDVDMHAMDCALFDTWFGESLEGHVEVWNSVILNLTNLSSDSGHKSLTVRPEESPAAQLLGVDVSELISQDLLLEGNAMVRIDAFKKATPRVVYRAIPAQYDLENRMLEEAGS